MYIQFYGTPKSNERIFNFGTQENIDGIVLWRTIQSNHFAFAFAIYDPAVSSCSITISPDFTPRIWTIIQIHINPADGNVVIKFNDFTATGSCGPNLSNRDALMTYVGRGISSNYELTASLAGFVAVDRLLSAAETSDVVARMKRGESVLEACVACPGTDTSRQGSI